MYDARAAGRTWIQAKEMIQAVMDNRVHPEQGYRACLGILRLGKSYGTDRLEAACKRALVIHSYSYRSIESILKTGLDSKPLPEATPQRTHPHHKNIRGPGYYS